MTILKDKSTNFRN